MASYRLKGLVALAAVGGATVQACAAPPIKGPAAFGVIVAREAAAAGLPSDIADAVMAVESGYDPSRIGGVGEIGLMQVRPGTASMLGFSGSAADLAKPEVNIHYGVAYLAGAWRQSKGDLCRALMKYRAGHGQETMSALSVAYCARAKAHLAAVGSPFAGGVLPVATAIEAPAASSRTIEVAQVDRRLKGAAFWAAHRKRIAAITARIERRWRRLASR